MLLSYLFEFSTFVLHKLGHFRVQTLFKLLQIISFTFKNCKFLYLSFILRLRMTNMLVYSIKMQSEVDTF